VAENKDGQEKTELATPKRLKEGQEKGQVAKSTDVTTAAVLMIGVMGIFLMGGELISSYQHFMKGIFQNLGSLRVTEEGFPAFAGEIIGFMSTLLLPIMFLVFFVALAAEISQVGLKIATKKFTEGLRFKQIFNTFSGMKRIFFSKHSLFELAKGLIKIFVLGSVVVTVLWNKDEEIIGLLERPFADVGILMANLAFEIMWKVGAVYIIIAFADFTYQKWKFKEDMKMTKKETKDESRQAEGDPMIKSRIRQLMRGRIRKLMLKNVKTADVVITNPTHFAIALAYSPGELGAPRVVAKGVDFMAVSIRTLAEDYDVPIVENPPLARTLFFSTEIDMEIPENLFKAVAQILAYVYTLKNKKL